MRLPYSEKHNFNKQAIPGARERRNRRRIELRVTTPQLAVRFVRDIGCCFLFPSLDIELPSLWDAVAGRVLKPTSSHSGCEIERIWGWKDALLGKKQWFYGSSFTARPPWSALIFFQTLTL